MSDDSSPHFLRTLIDEDLAAGTHQGVVRLRFPPEPNGYLHLGHAKSICLNFGLAEHYARTGRDARCHLRFDDTNPTAEDPEYVAAIQRDLKWLGYDWGPHLYWASDYFEFFWHVALRLVRVGVAYVDSQSEAEIRLNRGTVTEAGTASPFRDRSVEDNLRLLHEMRAGQHPEGSHVLRAKADMASPNMKMRDFLLYRIIRSEHFHVGAGWNVYPMYDFAHCLEDAIEGITHSFCTLEFDNNREIYDWVLDRVWKPGEAWFAAAWAELPADKRPPDAPRPWRPFQHEFARLNVNYTVMSKRLLLQLVKQGVVEGWDDPRMPTLAGIRRRGIRPEALRAFAEKVGLAKANSTVDMALLEYCVREDLDAIAPRLMAVTDPLEVVITNWPAGRVDLLNVPRLPNDASSTREVPFAGKLYLERDDYRDDPPPGFHRLVRGGEVRLRYGCVIRCDDVERDASGAPVRLLCTADLDSFGGKTSDGRKVKGIVHWVSAEHALPATFRLVDRLLRSEAAGDDFLADISPDSLVERQGWVEPSVVDDAPDTRWQFERAGFFWRDPTLGRGEQLVFTRIVTLKDGFARSQARATPPAAIAAKPAAVVAATRTAEELRDGLADDAARARFDALVTLALTPEDAAILADDHALHGFFIRTATLGVAPAAIAAWTNNQLRAVVKERDGLDGLPFTPAHLAAMIRLIDEGVVSNAGARKLFEALCVEGGDPAALVDALGLRQLSDANALQAEVDKVLAAFPAEVEAYHGGKDRLLGFFVGKVLAATGGKANPGLVKDLVTARLAG